MKFTRSAIFVALLLSEADAFSTTFIRRSTPTITTKTAASSATVRQQHQHPIHGMRHQPSPHTNGYRSNWVLHSKADDNENEIERLKQMAAKLRAEAAALEASQSQAMADAAERAFRKFDTNQDGQISLDELKEGLEKAFKTELPEIRVKKLMEDFDKTGDGTLKLEEFVTVEQFRNRLDALARDEKATARTAAENAKREEEAVKLLQAQLEMINDKAPSGGDKILSVLPYLFPLLDGLQFARFLVLENPDNIFSAIIGITYALYRSIPFGGFIAFFALSFLSGNPSINRLVRFNMQQAIYLDIALFFPGLIAALYSIVGGAVGLKLPAGVTEIGSDFMFVTLLATVAYCSISSLLGQEPNKIPLISDAVEARMPTVDMFDDKGRFQPRRRQDEEDKTDKKDDKM
jgi:Chloroplast import apparatus Tic20-like/EF-hand domain pair